MKILGIDWGTKRIGIAISNMSAKIAFPRPYIKNNKKAIEEIMTIISKENIKLVLVGIPLMENGGESDSTFDATKFFEKIKNKAKIDVQQFDERYTTRIAENVLESFGMKWQKSREIKDSISAVIMLQGYIDGQDQK